MPGRRWSDGLHQVHAYTCPPAPACVGSWSASQQPTAAADAGAQHCINNTHRTHGPLLSTAPLPSTTNCQAIEAKEALEIQNESITLASISYQVRQGLGVPALPALPACLPVCLSARACMHAAPAVESPQAAGGLAHCIVAPPRRCPSRGHPTTHICRPLALLRASRTSSVLTRSSRA